ncbi:MAG: YgfZ/GcvT domain-containing protein [Opitutales bacterium]
MDILQHTPYFLWQPASWLRVTGGDALEFLQGQHTQELSKLVVGGTAYGLWLNQKGKVVADSFVNRAGASEFWVGSYASPAATIRARLEAYIIADDVALEDVTAVWGGVTFFTSQPEEEVRAHLPGGVIFRGRRGGEPHWEWVAPLAQRAGVLANLAQAAALDRAAMELRRIEAGVPAVPADIGPDDLPNEGGLDADAISYTKGCYLGQEVMARLNSMGQVRRRLVRVHGPGLPPELPASLWAGDRRVGELRSAVTAGSGFIGLALINLMAAQAAPAFSLAAGSPPLIGRRDPA